MKGMKPMKLNISIVNLIQKNSHLKWQVCPEANCLPSRIIQPSRWCSSLSGQPSTRSPCYVTDTQCYLIIEAYQWDSNTLELICSFCGTELCNILMVISPGMPIIDNSLTFPPILNFFLNWIVVSNPDIQMCLSTHCHLYNVFISQKYWYYTQNMMIKDCFCMVAQS